MAFLSVLVLSVQIADAKVKTKEEFEKNFKTRIDSDDDGKCTKEEWMKFAQEKYKKDPEESYQKTFIPWDADKDGILTMEEYVSARLAAQEKAQARKKKK